MTTKKDVIEFLKKETFGAKKEDMLKYLAYFRVINYLDNSFQKEKVTYKDGAYYWVKLKKEYLNPDRPNENAWVVARYTEETDEDYEVFYVCGLYCLVEPEDLEEIGEEIKRGSED